MAPASVTIDVSLHAACTTTSATAGLRQHDAMLSYGVSGNLALANSLFTGVFEPCMPQRQGLLQWYLPTLSAHRAMIAPPYATERVLGPVGEHHRGGFVREQSTTHPAREVRNPGTAGDSPAACELPASGGQRPCWAITTTDRAIRFTPKAPSPG